MKKELRFCIEYVCPTHPLNDDGSVNVRHFRTLSEEEAENALERAKELCDVADTFTITIHDICTIFPELQEQESEDERIREALIKILNKIVINTNYKELGIDYNIRDMIAWLEKQCEKTHAELSQQKVTKTSDQELSDKMEPKTLDADKLYDEVTKPHWISVEDELSPRNHRPLQKMQQSRKEVRDENS